LNSREALARIALQESTALVEGEVRKARTVLGGTAAMEQVKIHI